MLPDLPDLTTFPVAVLRGQPAIAVPRLPHAPPFRLLDRVLHIDVAGGSLWALKQISINDALWPAEQSVPTAAVPHQTDLPALLLIEALSQAAACFNLLASEPTWRASSAAPIPAQPSVRPSARPAEQPSAQERHLGFLVSVSDFRFPAAARGGARVGDTVLLYVQKQESLGAVVAFSAQALCPIDGRSGDRLLAGLSQRDPRLGPTEPEHQPARLLGQGRLLFAVTSK